MTLEEAKLAERGDHLVMRRIRLDGDRLIKGSAEPVPTKWTSVLGVVLRPWDGSYMLVIDEYGRSEALGEHNLRDLSFERRVWSADGKLLPEHRP